ncbi:MAG: hypothetical protein IRZ16_18370 [Myxococcaceae bacterium]|nr:hypothetical protein [Myxococcaceae bacterium]
MLTCTRPAALLVVAGLVLSLAIACAHRPTGGDPESARRTADLFHHRIRWKDYGGASLLLVPEKREAFEEARRLLNDSRDLTISDYQLDELQLVEGGTAARVVSKIFWYRLPSVSAREDTVVTDFVYRDGTWMIARQVGGPFDEELSAPYVPPDADAGTGSAAR